MSDAKEWHYVSQVIGVLAKDMGNDALRLHTKRELEAGGGVKGLGKFDITGEKGDTNTMIAYLPSTNKLPEKYCQPESRLYILGHGDINSTVIATARSAEEAKKQSIAFLTYEPKVFAPMVRGWLGGRKVKRISFLMCFGGGNRGAASGAGLNPNSPSPNLRAFLETYKTPPAKSFAKVFAMLAGDLANEVSARTEESRTNEGQLPVNGVLMPSNVFNVVGPENDARHKGFGDKFIWTTGTGAGRFAY